MNNVTIGMDLGDKKHQICVFDKDGNEIKSCNVANTQKELRSFYREYKGATVAIEAGTHSPWISRLLTQVGCNVLVGNPRKLRAIWDSNDKADPRDAEMLGQIARFNPKLLYPVTHRGERAQVDLELLKARDMLVKNRTNLINHVRGAVKAIGERLPKCSTPSFHKKANEHLPNSLRSALQPLLELIENLTEKIKEFDKQVEVISKEQYPESELLLAISGIGPLTALAFLLIIEEHNRFEKSRQVGKYLGLTPKRDQSGESDKQLRITKSGNMFLRRLLVQASQYILGVFGPDCDLRRFGLRIAQRGGKNAKRRAVVAVARKLAVLMHGLWRNGEIYDPNYKLSKYTLKEAA